MLCKLKLNLLGLVYYFSGKNEMILGRSLDTKPINAYPGLGPSLQINDCYLSENILGAQSTIPA
jgi:hypothetical protein